VRGWTATYQQVKAGLRTGDTGDIDAAQSADNGGANLGDGVVQTLDLVDAAGQTPSGAKLPKGPWNSRALLAYIALEYPQVSLSETQALTTVKELGDGRKKGVAYVATITACKAWASRTYGPPLSAQTPALAV
jgi:hypothetical protein